MIFFKSKFFKIIIAIVIVLVALMLFSFATGKSNIINYVTSIFITPIQTVSETIGNRATFIWDKFTKYPSVSNENEELKKKISELETEVNKSKGLFYENSELRNLLDFKEKTPDLSLKTGTIISKSFNEWVDSFNINIGSTDGVKKGNAVITDIGFVGIISEVSINNSKVITMYNPECIIGAKNVRTNDPSILQGDLSFKNSNKAKLSFFDNKSDLKVDDIIVTSGLSENFPSNIKLGTVAEILTDTNGLSKYAKVIPIVDINNINKVFVVTSFEDSLK